jgi:hypothetical protein
VGAYVLAVELAACATRRSQALPHLPWRRLITGEVHKAANAIALRDSQST